jgi:hypothetical protein
MHLSVKLYIFLGFHMDGFHILTTCICKAFLVPFYSNAPIVLFARTFEYIHDTYIIYYILYVLYAYISTRCVACRDVLILFILFFLQIFLLRKIIILFIYRTINFIIYQNNVFIYIFYIYIYAYMSLCKCVKVGS